MNQHRKFEFSKMDYPEALQHFAYIQPYLTAAAEQFDLQDLLEKFNVKIDLPGRAEYFHMLTGQQSKPSQNATINLTYDLFRTILFIDFGRWPTSEEFCRHLYSLAPDAEECLTLLCQAWHRVSYAAAQGFFSSQANLRRYFAKFATAWWNSTSTARSEHIRYAQEFTRSVHLAGKDVLEAACGFGRLSQAYQGAKSLVRLDLSIDMLREAKSCLNPRIAYYCVGDLSELPLARRSFDAVTAMQITMHLTDPFDVLRVLGQTLKTSGELWTDFTCTRRDLGERAFFQESFFTRIYDRKYVIEKCLSQGYSLVSAPLEIQEQHDHYWLLLHLSRNE